MLKKSLATSINEYSYFLISIWEEEKFFLKYFHKKIVFFLIVGLLILSPAIYKLSIYGAILTATELFQKRLREQPFRGSYNLFCSVNHLVLMTSALYNGHMSGLLPLSPWGAVPH